MRKGLFSRDRKDRFFVYLHENGGTHLKRCADQGDVDEMVESDLVDSVFEITEFQWWEFQREPTSEEKVAGVLMDWPPNYFKSMFPDGVIRVLKQGRWLSVMRRSPAGENR